MKIIHFSDPHAGGPAEDWMAYVDKRWVGVFNYSFRRKFQHDQSLLTKAVDFILREKPDLAVCTGDLTSTGQPGEFERSLKILRPLRESKIPLIYVPGNHDCYVKSKKCVNAMKNVFSYLNGENFGFGDLPVLKNFSGIDFIIVNESYPTNLISSCGYLKKPFRDFVIEKCSAPKKNPRIIIGHYPLIEDKPFMRVRHRLWGQKKILELLKSGALDLSLCGHMHMPYAKIDPRGRGEICAGSITRNSCLAVIEYLPEDDIFKYRKVILQKEG